MRQNARKLVTLIILLIVILIIGGYGYFRSRDYLTGPIVRVDTPLDGKTQTEALIVVRGFSKNVSFLTLNGNKIFVDELGEFKEQLLLFPGYNIITLEAKDRFGRQTKKTLELVYKEPQKEITASYTPS